MSTSKKTSEYYQDAIKECEMISADFETEESVRREANCQITFCRTKIQESGLDEIVGRTEKLKALMTGMQTLVNKAQGAGMADKISGVASLTNKVRSIVEGN